jgi:hypothetical protein
MRGMVLRASLGCLLLGPATVALAGDWKLTDSTSVALDYVDRSGSDPSSGVVARLSPGFTLRGRGGRTQADMSYQLTLADGTRDTDPRNISHNLRANGRMEVVDDVFFLGGSATAGLVGNTSTSGPVDEINAGSDGGQSFAAEIRPEFRQHLNRYADIVSSNRLNYTSFNSDGDSRGDDDSTGVTLNLGIQSGRHFSATNWSVNTTQTKTRFDDRTDKRETVTGATGYRIDSTWRVRGTVGYEKNDVDTQRDDTDGATWSGGVDWTPNPRNSASFDYGSRYFGETFSANYRHRSRRTFLVFDLSRDISNRRSQQFYDELFVGIDPVTGTPVFFEGLAVEQIDEDFLNTQFRASATFTGRRSSLTVSGNIANRDYEVTDRDEDAYTLSARFTRQLGNDISGSLGGSYQQTDVKNSADSDTFDLTLSLSKRISTYTSAAITALHRERNSSDGADDYTENRIGFSLTTSFLSR